MKSSLRVFIIGLDGGTLDLIVPWVEAGNLPSLARVIRGGISGQLQSTFPPLTGSAWSSFMTGKSPGQHGILEFFQRREGSYQQFLHTRMDIDGKPLWNYLGEGGKKVGVMGVPLTYPPAQVNGFLITGLLTPSGRRDFTYPPDLLNELEQQLGCYRLRHDEKYRSANPRPFLQEEDEILENNTQAALYLLTHKPWDFFMVHIYGTDRIQHELWHLFDPTHPQHDPAELKRLGNVVLSFFQKVDAAIGQLLNVLDDDTVVILMSDHGFGPVWKFLNMNTWLLKQGLLRLKQTPATQLRYRLFQMGFNYSVLAHWVLRLGMGSSAVKMGRDRREAWQRRIFLSLNDIDWSRTLVYSIGNFGQLYVNLKGREPLGIVSAGPEYDRLLDDLTQRLGALRDPESGEPVVERVMRKEDVYCGPYLHCAPDLMFYTTGMRYKAMGLSDFSSSRVFDPVYGTTGHHRMNGLLIAHGPGIFKTGERLDGAEIQDLAPTILYLMGQPVPREMDGQVLLDLFTEDFKQGHALQYSEDQQGNGETPGEQLTELEEAELVSVLRSLGYVT